MNMVDLRRMQRRGAAVAAFACMAVMPLKAEVANPNLVPADSAYILSVPDSAAAWKAWEANGLYDAFQKLKAMPDVKSKLADFEKELSIIESSLGFKLNGETMSTIFSSADIFIQAPEANQVKSVGIFKVADADKLSKLMDLAEKAAAKAAESDDGGSTETASADNATSAVVATDYDGVQIKAFKGGENNETKFLYARTGDFLIASSDEDALKKTIDRTKSTTGTAAAGTFASSEPHKKIEAALAKEKGEVYAYSNPDLANRMNSSGDVPAAVQGSLQKLMNNVAPVSYTGASIKISPKEIYGYSYGLLKEGSSESLALKNPGDKPLRVAQFIPETTMVGFATSLLDAQAIADLVSGIAGSTDADGDLSDKVKQAEAGLGFSVKNDLVPAIGNEVGFSLSKVEFSGLLPTVDATIIIGVKDKARMTKVTQGVERMATNVMAARASSDDSTSAPEMLSEEVDGQTVKYVEVQGLAGLSPGYVLTDEFLFIGSTKNALTSALKASSGGNSLASGSTLSSLGHGISGNGNAISYVNIGKLLDVARNITQMIPAAQGAGKYIDTLDVIDASGQVSRVEGDAIVSRGVLKLK